MMDAALEDDGGMIQVAAIANGSLAHMIILMRNADAGYGSLAPSELKHGNDIDTVAGMMVHVYDVQAGATSARIAAVSTYLLRAVTNSSRKLKKCICTSPPETLPSARCCRFRAFSTAGSGPTGRQNTRGLLNIGLELRGTVVRLAGAGYNSSSSCRILPWGGAPAVPACQCLCSTGSGIPGRARVPLLHG